jgi:hypothetical protein
VELAFRSNLQSFIDEVGQLYARSAGSRVYSIGVNADCHKSCIIMNGLIALSLPVLTGPIDLTDI